MNIRKAILAAPLALGACDYFKSDEDNTGDKVGEYTCRVQEGASDALTNSSPVIVGNKVFATDSDIYSRFESHDVKYRLPNIFNQTGGLDIHFITNQAALDDGDKRDLGRLANQINNIGGDVTVLLEGYADARGSDSVNERMATKRIESVEEYISSQLNPNVQVTFEHASFGETVAQQNTSNLSLEEKLELRKDRKVVVSISGNTITAGLNRSPADAYLLDASGSMAGESWQVVSGYNFPDNSSIYTFTDTQSRFDNDDCADSLDSQIVDGQTPLLVSIMDILQTGEYDNKIITILSDGGDNVGGFSSSTIIDEAQARKVTINVIGIGSADTYLLRNLAESTGGKYTIER